MKTVCMNCTDRVPGCHGNCPAYLEYREKRKQELELRFKQSDVDDYMYKAIHRSKISTREGREKYA